MNKTPKLRIVEYVSLTISELVKLLIYILVKCENTSNMIAHLQNRHNITKSNYIEYLDENKQV